MRAPVDAVEPAQRAEREDGGADGAHHDEQLEQRRRGREARVDGDVHRQAGERRRRSGQIGVDAHHLGPKVPVEATGARHTGVVGQAVERGGGGGDVGVEADGCAGGRLDLRPRCRRDRHVPVQDVHGRVGDADEHRVERRALAAGGGRREQQPAAGGERGHRGARHRHGHRLRNLRHQGSVDAVERAVLGPADRRVVLRDRQERRQDGEQRTQQTGDDGDEASGAVLRSHVVPAVRSRVRCACLAVGCRRGWHGRSVRHGYRCYATVTPRPNRRLPTGNRGTRGTTDRTASQW